MKFSRKSLVFLLLIVVFANLVLVGCKKKPAEKKASYDGIELTYYKMFDDEDVIKPVIAEFEKTHPGLRINYRMFNDFREYQALILNEMAEGRGPDIFSMQNTWFQSNYRKLNPMPEALGNTNAFASVFVDVAYQDLVRPDDDGVLQVYAVPMTVDTLALYYNKGHFEDRIPASGRPSTTWEGIKEDILLLNKTDNSFGRLEVAGIALGRSDNISRAVDILYLLFLQYGVEFYNENISQAIFAGQQGGATRYPAIEALDLFTSFADESQKHYSWNEFMVDDDSEAEEVEAFARGKVSMIVGYSYTYDDIVNEIALLKNLGATTIDEGDIRIAAIPQVFDPAVSTQKRVTYASYFAETISRNSAHPDLAWDFLLELTKKTNLEYYFDKLHKPTSRRDMIDDQKSHPIYGVFASQIGFAESFPIMDYYAYKSIFENVITKANISGSGNRTDLVGAQDLITDMLPEEGVIVPPKEDAGS